MRPVSSTATRASPGPHRSFNLVPSSAARRLPGALAATGAATGAAPEAAPEPSVGSGAPDRHRSLNKTGPASSPYSRALPPDSSGPFSGRPGIISFLRGMRPSTVDHRASARPASGHPGPLRGSRRPTERVANVTLSRWPRRPAALPARPDGDGQHIVVSAAPQGWTCCCVWGVCVGRGLCHLAARCTAAGSSRGSCSVAAHQCASRSARRCPPQKKKRTGPLDSCAGPGPPGGRLWRRTGDHPNRRPMFVTQPAGAHPPPMWHVIPAAPTLPPLPVPPLPRPAVTRSPLCGICESAARLHGRPART